MRVDVISENIQKTKLKTTLTVKHVPSEVGLRNNFDCIL